MFAADIIYPTYQNVQGFLFICQYHVDHSAKYILYKQLFGVGLLPPSSDKYSYRHIYIVFILGLMAMTVIEPGSF
jgi:hypothetical protein